MYQFLVAMNNIYENNNDEYVTNYKYVFKCSFLKTFRHRIPSTTMYYLQPNDCHWVLDGNFVGFEDGEIARVELVRVSEDCYEYEMAVNNNMICRRNERYKNVLVELNRYISERRNKVSACN